MSIDDWIDPLWQPELKRSIAIAHLIAAAPELYEALTTAERSSITTNLETRRASLLPDTDGDAPDINAIVGEIYIAPAREALETARAALAKAQGGSQ